MPAFRDEPVSPELALVDPVLRERLLRESLQELLHERTEVLRRTHPGVEPLVATPGSNSPELQAQHGRRQAGRLRAHGSSVAAATVAALFLALPSLAFLPPRQAPHFGPEIRSLRQDTIVAWQPDPAADYYLFEISMGGRQVKVEPVRGSSVTLGASLAPGLYAWRVFAGRGPMANHETQGPIAGGTVALE